MIGDIGPSVLGRRLYSFCCLFFFVRVLDGCVVLFQAEDGIRDLVRSRGLGDVYKRQAVLDDHILFSGENFFSFSRTECKFARIVAILCDACLLYTSDAADERSSVDLGGRRIIKKKKQINNHSGGGLE